MNKTVLHPLHVEMSAKMVDFGGWDMPIHYGSQVEEHHLVRKHCGMFDVSHMTVVDLKGSEVMSYLGHLLANDPAKLKEKGKALYSCMLNDEGGVVDDLIVYYLDDDFCRMVVNASTREKDIAWLQSQAGEYDLSITERPELAIIAVQGPEAREKAQACLDGVLAEEAFNLKRFSAFYSDDRLLARTGYTGEDGFEIILPENEAPALWRKLHAAGVMPCGLGARDTLRLEAAMNLYGQDMDETTSPLESGLAWTVSMDSDRAFVGRQALEKQKSSGLEWQLTGMLLQSRGVLRHGQKVQTSGGEGEITSGTFSPTLQQAIALVRVPVGCASECQVDIRGKLLPAILLKPPFVRNGEASESVKKLLT